MITALEMVQLFMNLPPNAEILMMDVCEHGDLVLADVEIWPIGTESLDLSPFPPAPKVFIGTQGHAMVALDILNMDESDYE